MTTEKQQKAALGKLWKLFDYNKESIAKACSVPGATVRAWFSRGRISATAAIKLEQHKTLVKAGLTKEELRPDVKEWFGV